MPVTTVRDLMTTDVVCLQVDTTLDKAAKVMRERDIGDVVVAEDDKLIGLVTDRDIVLRAVADGLGPATTTLGAVVTRDLVTVRPDDTARSAALLMREQAVRRVLVVDDQGLVGILSFGDLTAWVEREPAPGGISSAPSDN